MTTSKQQREKINTTSADIAEERLAQLRQLLPEVFTEGKVDFDKLRAALGDHVDDRPERYNFTWAGKRDAIRLLQTPTSATLVPARDESIEFDDTSHIFIEGENLEVLKLLYKAYFGQVKLIYIDPPYNTGNDFVYPDNYTDPLEPYLQITGQKDTEGNLLTSNADSSGRFHSSWLTMMYSRLFIARQLLKDDGAIFISIDDNEFHNLRLILNEIFGEENFVGTIVWQKRTSPDARATLGAAHDYVLVYAKALENFKEVFRLLPLSEKRSRAYTNTDNDPRGPWASVDMTGQTGHATPSQFYEIATPSGVKYRPPEGRCWALAEDTFKKMVAEGRIWFGKNGDARPRIKRYLSEADGMAVWSWWSNGEVGHNQEATKELNDLLQQSDVFNNPKPTRLIDRILRISTSPKENEIVLDFFAGSCTVAHSLIELNREEQGNRRFIMVQLPEPIDKANGGFSNIADVGKKRIHRAIDKAREEDVGKLPLDFQEDLGFRVFKLNPSHFKPWQGTPGTDPARYNQQLELFRDPLLDGWQPEPVIWEVALKEGYPLHSRVTAANVTGHTVYRVQNPDSGQHFHICLEPSITTDIPRQLQLASDALFICRDLALDDTTAANLALQCRLKTI